MSKQSIRCAVYTRKSTEEGLDQEFNSLDAQREACEAYVRSQKAEGWIALKDRFDDGGFSGGNIERPGLMRLLERVEKGLVDVVVVYKIDRLTRSLADFAKIVERFEKRNASFVSVTQSFNTTSSMGRLTLNVLLSFAQFEREVTAERIRDKVFASRKKGIFMGGTPPLGYDARDRRLVINEPEAETVRLIFSRYLALGSVTRLRCELDEKAIRTKSWVTTKGKAIGGGRWFIGPLRHILRNRVYVGEAVHKGTAYPGQHDSIIDRALFDAVQAKLNANSNEHREKRTTLRRGLLTGLLFDDRGNAMSPSLSRKPGGGSYLYYISQARIQRREANAMRPIPAEAIETIVCERVAGLAIPACSGDEMREHLRDLITRVDVGTERISITFNPCNLSRYIRAEGDRTAATLRQRLRPEDTLNECDDKLVLITPACIPRRGGVRRVEAWEKSDWATPTVRHDTSLIKALTDAHEWRELIERGEMITMEDLATRTGHDRKYVRRTLKLAFLAPDIQRAILEGRQPRSLTSQTLGEIDVPLLWSEQRTLLSFPAT